MRKSIQHWAVYLSIEAVLLVLTAQTGLAADFSGRVWEDLDRNGIRESGEPPMSGYQVYLSEHPYIEWGFSEPFVTNTTDVNGHYEFMNVTNPVSILAIAISGEFRLTIQNVGNDETIDSDFQQWPSVCAYYPAHNFSNGLEAVNNMDAGVYALMPGFSISACVNGITNCSVLYVTNGAPITLLFRVSNTGESALSEMLYIASHGKDGNDYQQQILQCPSILSPGEAITFTNVFTVTHSITNQQGLVAFPVDPCSCISHGTIPPFCLFDTAIIVVTNDPVEFDDGDGLPNEWEMRFGLDPFNPSPPGRNSDADWMTDAEEFWADTNPTNASSFLPATSIGTGSISIPETSTTRIYSALSTEDLLSSSPAWMPYSPERAGTGSVIQFPFPDNPFATLRIGVRVP